MTTQKKPGQLEEPEQQGSPRKKEKQSNNSESQRALKFLINILFGAGAVIFFYALAVCNKNFFSIVSVSLLLLGAAALSGGLVGFLFGIPRSLQNDKSIPQSPAPNQSAPGSSAHPADSVDQNRERNLAYASNTNLEQISDWLTKILVGVGLTQLQQIQSGINSIIGFATPALGGVPYAGPFAGSLLVLGSILGFLFGYLWARLFLLGAFLDADKINILTEKVDELKRQGEYDAYALNLIDRLFGAGGATITQQQIKDAISKASASVKMQIYYRARDFRSKTWRDPSSKALMELTIPVFKALIDLDQERKYHNHHGQLAFALKDKNNPDYAGAEKSFTTAIDIRGTSKEFYQGFYELYRAVCIIKQDPNFESGKPSDEKTTKRIIADLKHASLDDEAWKLAQSESIITEWCTINAIDLASLKFDKPNPGD